MQWRPIYNNSMLALHPPCPYIHPHFWAVHCISQIAQFRKQGCCYNITLQLLHDIDYTLFVSQRLFLAGQPWIIPSRWIDHVFCIPDSKSKSSLPLLTAHSSQLAISLYYHQILSFLHAKRKFTLSKPTSNRTGRLNFLCIHQHFYCHNQ